MSSEKEAPQASKQISETEPRVKTPEGSVRSWFSRESYGAAFGSYEGISDQEPPWNQALMGRHPQRAKLLNLLFSSAGRGAYLITGHRGSGKTTFVDYCLEEYRKNVFERFLRRNVGRSFFWDRFGFLALATALLLLMLLHQDILRNIITATMSGSLAPIFGWPLVTTFTLISLAPFVLSTNKISLIYERAAEIAPTNNTKAGRIISILTGAGRPNPFALVATILLWLVILLHPSLGSLKAAMAQCFLLCSCIFWSCYIVGIYETSRQILSYSREDKSLSRPMPTIKAGAIAIITYAYFYLIDVFTSSDTLNWDILYVGCSLIALSCLALSWQIFETVSRFKPPEGDPSKFQQSVRAARSTGRWATTAGIMVVAVSTTYLIFNSIQYPNAGGWINSILTLCLPLALPTTISVISLLKYKEGVQDLEKSIDDASRRSSASTEELNLRLKSQFALVHQTATGFRSYPLIILLIKSLLLVLLGTYLSLPALTLIASQINAQYTQHILPYLTKPFMNHSLATEILVNGGTLTHGVTDVATWIAGWLYLGSFIGFLEYEWIIRSHQMERQDPATQLTQREIRKWTFRDTSKTAYRTNHSSESKPDFLFEYGTKHYYQRLAEQTLFWNMYMAWQPLLIVPVNLGFDALDHHRVVEAMLTGLKEAYQKTFLNWSSPIFASLKLLGIATTVTLTFQASWLWFYLDPSKTEAIQEGIFCQKFANQSFETNYSKATGNFISESSPVQQTPSNDVVELENSSRGVVKIESTIVDPGLGTSQELAANARATPPLMRVACHIGSEPFAQILQWPLIPSSPTSRTDTGRRESLPRAAEPIVLGIVMPEVKAEGKFRLRFYHATLFVFFWLAGSYISRKNPIFPFKKTLASLDDLIASLSSRKREESQDSSSLPQKLLGFLTGDQRVQFREADPFDPRSVELATISVLHRIQEPAWKLPLFDQHRINLPVPEIIFKFDELDKLGLGVIPPHDVTGPEVEQADTIHRERRRAESLRNLFSDLKNVVCSGSARFIFIGGRNLHDEWLADQTARRPLLTNIFEVELYLPSLLVDQAIDSERGLWGGIEDYLLNQRLRSEALNEKTLRLKYRPWLTPWVEERQPPAFGLSSIALLVRDSQRSHQKIARNLDSPPLGDNLRRIGHALHEPPNWNPTFQRDFVHFLTYRSHGHVKKLRTLVEDFLSPSGAAMVEGDARNMALDCQHVLLFRDIDRFRIQLIADIFRHILASFDPKISFRDDKLVVSVLYLSDFLLKFHRRAFTWNSLQKVDELAHIHRAPDLPQAVNTLVFKWLEPFLHTIRNGMYDYRFNSDFARELEYLSRRSEEELAAFNFTLDESQALKAIYRSRIQAVKEPESYETITALGELHDFDQEYEVARYYYIQAMDLLDQHFHNQTGKTKDTPTSFLLLQGKRKGQHAARLRLTWGITRLRIKLQVAMTFERPRELEQAQIHYRNARTLAAQLVRALIETDGAENLFKDSLGNHLVAPNPDEVGPDYVSTVKHLFILFQPPFAEAWVSEKVVGGVDTGVRLLERRLWELRWQLPFISERPYVGFAGESYKGQPASRHPNFALLIAEQHNRAGDLLFFKGTQPELSHPTPEARQRIPIGYLHRAHYHYALSLHDIRSFNKFRKDLLAEFSEVSANSQASALTASSWGDFIHRACAGSLADLSETLLAQVSLRLLLDEQTQATSSKLCSKSLRKKLDFVYSKLFNWLGGGNGSIDLSATAEIFPSIQERPEEWLAISDWLGQAKQISQAETSESGPISELLELEAPAHRFGNFQLIASYNIFCLAAGKILQIGGYQEDASRKYLRTVETTVNLFWWLSYLVVTENEVKGRASRPAFDEEILDFFPEPDEESSSFKDRLISLGPILLDLSRLGVEALRQATQLFLQARVNIETLPVDKGGPQSGLIGSRIPTSVPTLACNLGLAMHSVCSIFQANAASAQEQSTFLSQPLKEISTLLHRWTGKSLQSFDGRSAPEPEDPLLPSEQLRKTLREILRAHLESFSYPLIHRLNGIKVLHDDEALRLMTLEHNNREYILDEVTHLSEHLEELVELADIYESPLHFTPLQTGLSLSLSFLLFRDMSKEEGWTEAVWNQLKWRKGWETPDEIGRLARNHLQQSREMYTMGRMYFHSISDLYYLYDDFNDRRIHYNHAIQMAGSELNLLLDGVLKALLDD